ncbi:hypothetical protein BKA69DRAFT_1048671 [Paraphysoderma sedebokerense]|nr:hypothetical protein BKA69DRAFT_1048671 [Paraphysoderma sedebokerense]
MNKSLESIREKHLPYLPISHKANGEHRSNYVPFKDEEISYLLHESSSSSDQSTPSQSFTSFSAVASQHTTDLNASKDVEAPILDLFAPHPLDFSLDRFYFKRQHYINAITILRKLLLKREWTKALRLLKCLMGVQNIPLEVVWKTSIDALRSVERYSHECSRFYQHLLAIESPYKQQILLELATYYINHNEIDQAYNLVSGYIPIYPYSDNPYLLGVMGLLALFKHDEWRGRGKRSTGQRNSYSTLSFNITNDEDDLDEPPGQSVASSRHLNESYRYLQEWHNLDPNGFIYLPQFIHVLKEQRKFDEIHVVLRNFVKQNPRNVVGLRLLFSHLHSVIQSQSIPKSAAILEETNLDVSTEFISIGYALLSVDPFLNKEVVLLPLFNHYLQQADHERVLLATDPLSDQPELTNLIGALKILAVRLDFQCIDPDIWRTLAQTLQRIRTLSIIADESIWRGRRSWWLKFHFPELAKYEIPFTSPPWTRSRKRAKSKDRSEPKIFLEIQSDSKGPFFLFPALFTSLSLET